MNGFLDLFRDDFLSDLDRLLDDPLLDLECFPLDDLLFDLESCLLGDFHRFLLPDLESLCDELLLSELYCPPDELLPLDLDIDLLLDDLYFRDFDLLPDFDLRRQCLGLLQCFFLRFPFLLRFFSLLPQ